MKIAIMGSGGVGGYFGGRLAAAGNDVTFVARGAHLEAMQRSGLTVESTFGNFTISPAKATVDPASIGSVDAVIFAVKMGDTDGGARQLEALMRASPEAAIFTFQNGVESLTRVGAVVGAERVVSGVARIATVVREPGVINHTGRLARLEFGEADKRRSARVERFHSTCVAAGIDAVIAPDINRAIWMKFAMLAPMSGLTTLLELPIGPIRAAPGARKLLEDAVAEVLAVGERLGRGVGPGDLDDVMRTLDNHHATMTTSMAHDRAAGKPLELAGLSGAVARLAADHGLAAPTHAFIARALSAVEKGKPSV